MHQSSKNTSLHNIRLVKFFLDKAYPNGYTVEKLIEDNLIDGILLSELAVSICSNIDLCDVGVYQDLVDGTDVKTATVVKCKFISKKGITGYHFAARIQHIRNKIGALRCIVYNKYSLRWHYFFITEDACGNNDSIKITFDIKTQLPKGKWAKYEVDSFEDICKQIKKEGQ